MNTNISNYFNKFRQALFTSPQTSGASKTREGSVATAVDQEKKAFSVTPRQPRKALVLDEKQAFVAEQNYSRLTHGQYSEFIAPQIGLDVLLPEERRQLKSGGHHKPEAESYEMTAKAVRRQGMYISGGKTTTGQAERHQEDNMAADTKTETLNTIQMMLSSTLKGTRKLRDMNPIEREHIFKMLEANDVAGLQSVVNNGNPLRSFTTGFKGGTQAMARFKSGDVPEELLPALKNLNDVYQQSKVLTELGDANEKRLFKPRTSEDVQVLREAYQKADQALTEVEQAFAWWQENNLAALTLPKL